MPDRIESLKKLYEMDALPADKMEKLRQLDQLGALDQGIGKLATNEDFIAQLKSPEYQKWQPLAKQYRAEAEELPQKLAQQQGPVTSFFISAGKGMYNIGRGVGRMLGADYKATPQEETAMAALEKERPYSTTAGLIVGETAPFAPLSTVASGVGAIKGLGTAGKLAARFVPTIALGATESSLSAAGQGKTGKEIATAGGVGGTMAAVGEAVLPPVARRAAKIFKKIMGRAPKGALMSKGVPTPELQEALDKAGMTVADLGEEGATMLEKTAPYTDPDQAARAAFLEKMGFKENTAPTKAQIQRTASLFQDQQEAAKISGKVRGRLQNQNALLENQFMDMTKKTGGNPATTGSVVADDIINKATELDNQIGTMYEIARKTTGDQQIVPADKFFNELNTMMPDNDLTGGLLKAIKGIAKERGIIKIIKGNAAKGIPNKEIIRDISVSEAEDLVKSINQRYTSANKNSVRVGRILKDALDEDVMKAGGSDLFKQARKMKAKFHSDLERTSTSKFAKRKVSLPRDILEEQIGPDEILQKGIISKKYRPSDITDLKRYLQTGTKEQIASGKQAWDELRAEAMDYIKNQAFSGPEDELGRRTITRARLESALNKFGPEKLKVLFTPQEYQFLKDMQRVTQIMEPISGTYLGKGPTAQAVTALSKKIKKAVDTIPVLGAFTDLDLRSADAVLKGKPIIRKIEPITGQGYGGLAGAAAASGMMQGEQQP